MANQLIVEAATSQAAAAAAIAVAGGRLVWTGPRTGLLLVEFDNPEQRAAAEVILRLDSRVSGVFYNHVTEGTGTEGTGIATSPAQIPGLQWYLPGLSLTGGKSAEGVTVAVLDTGVAYEDYSDAAGGYRLAPDLSGVEFVAGYDFVNDDAHANDDHGHGTHITGVIASSSTVIPVAPDVNVMPVKVLDDANLGNELALAEGILFAVDRGADVINLSLSFHPGYFPSRFLQAAINHAALRGVLVVAAAGNHDVDTVSYPAAFRDVVAVGASRLKPTYRSHRRDPWSNVLRFLQAAEYSNSGYRLDVAAPGGAADGDANRDGLPEAVVAQSIVPGDPTQFEYTLWAGTSQATAQVTGVAALMLATNPTLTPFQVRALLGEQARLDHGLLSTELGRGHVRADGSVDGATAESSTPVARPRFSVALRLVLAENKGDDDTDSDSDSDSDRRRSASRDSGVIAIATVEVIDELGSPVPGAVVFGTFLGPTIAPRKATADRDGIATFRSDDLAGAPLLAFQVDAVAVVDDGVVVAFDRPSGAIRIDSCSLELLSLHAETGGTGVATSPRRPPIGITVPLAPGERPTINLLNYSWAGATLPLAVAVDPSWFTVNFPDSPVVESSGSGLAGSPVVLDPGGSFPVPVPPASQAPQGCSNLVVRTFAVSQISMGEGPVQPSPDDCGAPSMCEAQRDATGEVWDWATGGGVATSPSGPPPGWSVQTGWTRASYDQLVSSLAAWSAFANRGMSMAVNEYGSVLAASGISAPAFGSAAGDLVAR